MSEAQSGELMGEPYSMLEEEEFKETEALLPRIAQNMEGSEVMSNITSLYANSIYILVPAVILSSAKVNTK